MNERDDQTPFPREPWQRLLEDPGDGPSETADARIRAAARRDLAPRGQRWWLPAALAASFVLAVLVVRSELGTVRRLPMTESDRNGSETMDARIIDRNPGPEAREQGESPAALPARRESSAHRNTSTDTYGYVDAERGSDSPAGATARVGGPELDLKAASELPGEAAPPAPLPDSTGPVTSPPATPATALAAHRPAAEADAQAPDRVDEDYGTLARPPTPDAWYAAIEKLRAAGQVEEAERELERLKKAYPGWLERHLKEKARR